MPKKIIFFLILAFGILLSFQPALAESYDIYVDKDYSGNDSNGSLSKPFKTIDDALDEVDSRGKKIYIKNGTYQGDFTLEKGVELYGQDRNKTIIENSGKGIVAKDKNTFKNLSITEGSYGISFEGEGEIEKCTIKNASNVGINLTARSSEFKLKDSKISDNRKGIYAQRGRTIEITDNDFIDNSEEGIDIREKSRGIIADNTISDNGESGIEIIVGSANISIYNNLIKNNKASGIATQFYSDFDKTGKISIKNNTISKNKSYGIVCKAPSGGDIPKGYWNNSLELSNTKIEDNKNKSISTACKLIEAVTEEEEKSNQTLESAEAMINPEEKITAEDKKGEDKIKNEEEERILQEKIEKENQINSQINGIFLKRGILNTVLSENKNKIIQTGKIKTFFFGPDYKSLKTIQQTTEKLESEKASLKRLNGELESLGNNEKSQANLETLGSIEAQIEEYKSFLLEQNAKKSLFGWIIRMWKK